MPYLVFLAASFLLVSRSSAETHTVSATGEYRMGDNDTRTDAKRLALTDAKRLALEQVGTYIESISEVHNMQLTRDDIRSYTAGMVEIKEAMTRAELDKDQQSTIIYVDVVCQIDSDVLTRQLENLRKNESASRELNSLRMEVEKLRVLLAGQSRVIDQAKTKKEQDRLITERQETMKSIDANDFLAQSWVALAGSESYITYGSSSKTGREEARRLIQQVFTVAPQNAKAHRYLGIIFFEEGNCNGAIEEFHKAISLSPDDADSYSNLGIALYARGDRDSAISEFRLAIKKKPDDALNYYNLGIALKDKGSREDAIEAFHICIRLSTDGNLKVKAEQAILKLDTLIR